MKKNLNLKVAVIDIGSNSCRLMLKTNSDKQKFLVMTRLAEGKANGYLSDNSINRTVNGVKALFDKALKLGANDIYIFATAAVRNSLNGNVVCDEIKKQTGVGVDVVSGELEAELAVLGALQGRDGGIIDIGGASTEIAFKQANEIVYGVSYKFGCVSLLNDFAGDYSASQGFLQNNLKGVRRVFNGGFVGVGGTITTLAGISLSINEYDASKIQSATLTISKVNELAKELKGLTKDEIISRYPLASKRADIIAYGAQILLSVMQAYGIDEIKVSDSDNLEGYLEYLTRDEKV